MRMLVFANTVNLFNIVDDLTISFIFFVDIIRKSCFVRSMVQIMKLHCSMHANKKDFGHTSPT